MNGSTIRKSGRAQKRTPHFELIEARTNKGWTPNDLALRAGIDGKTVRMAEAGWIPGPRIQLAIAKQFELRPTDLWPIRTGAFA